MNQRDFYTKYVKPWLTNDKPMNRMIFNNESDKLCKAGEITLKQYNNWCCPNTKKFYADSELKHLRRVK